MTRTETRLTQDGGSDVGGVHHSVLGNLRHLVKQMETGVVSEQDARAALKAQVDSVNDSNGDASVPPPAAPVCAGSLDSVAGSENGSHHGVVINAAQLGRLTTQQEQASDARSGHGSDGGIVQHNAKALTVLPPQTQDGVVGGGAESVIMQQKPSPVLGRILESARLACVSRNMLQDRLKELQAAQDACAKNREFKKAAKLREEKAQTEKALGDVDLVRAQQKKAVEEHID